MDALVPVLLVHIGRRPETTRGLIKLFLNLLTFSCSYPILLILTHADSPPLTPTHPYSLSKPKESWPTAAVPKITWHGQDIEICFFSLVSITVHQRFNNRLVHRVNCHAPCIHDMYCPWPAAELHDIISIHAMYYT